MEPKRKVNGGAAAVEELDSRAAKRRRLPDGDGETAETTSQHGIALLAQIEKLSDRSGRQVAEDFLELPSKKELPDYYVYIKMPVALNSIANKVKRRDFPNLTALESMFQRMVANARLFNEEGSGIVDDANRILKCVTTYMKKENPAYKTPGYVPFPTPIPGETPTLQDNQPNVGIEVDVDGEVDHDAGSVSTPSASKRSGRSARKPSYPQLMAAAKARSSATPARSESQPTGNQFAGLTFQQAQDRIVSDMINYKESEEDDYPAFEAFHNLPSRSLKEYYQVIPHPVSLKGLQKLVRGVHGRNEPTMISDFKTWAAFEEEVSAIWKNAWHFNEDGSDISIQAQELKDYFETLLTQAKSSVSEPSGPKFKIKMPASEPAPKITLRMGGKASPAHSPAPIPAVSGTSQSPQNGARRFPPGAQTSVSNVPATSQLDRARSASRAAASPTPSMAPIVKNEDIIKQSPAIPSGILPATPATISAVNHNSIAVQVNGSAATMMPPGTPGINGGINGVHQYTPTAHPFQPVAAPNYEQKWRQPGKTAADAMIANLQISTHPGLNIQRHFRMDVPPSDHQAQYSITIQLPATHYYLQIKPTIAAPLLQRQHKLFVTSGLNRLHAMSTIPGQPVDNRQPLFEARLLPGVNRIEIELIAALPKGERGPNGQDAEIEKITVFANLLR